MYFQVFQRQWSEKVCKRSLRFTLSFGRRLLSTTVQLSCVCAKCYCTKETRFAWIIVDEAKRIFFLVHRCLCRRRCIRSWSSAHAINARKCLHLRWNFMGIFGSQNKRRNGEKKNELEKCDILRFSSFLRVYSVGSIDRYSFHRRF